MHEISNILAVVDPTAETQPAMHRAAWLAQHTGAELELLICYYSAYLSGDPFFESPSLDRARGKLISEEERQLEDLAEPFRQQGIVVKTTALWDHPLYKGVVREIIKSGADIVFKDTHHHSAVSRALLSNTDWSLIRTCPVPLWLVKPRDVGTEPAFVAAIDPIHDHDNPAELDEEVLQTSQMLGRKVGGVVHAFHSVSELTYEELAAFATRVDAAVVVMGTVGRNRWKRLFMGSTAERTLEHLPCDLLIVKPNWFQTPVGMTNPDAARPITTVTR